MKITDRKIAATYTETLHIEDGDVRPQPYSSAGRKYRVDMVTIRAAWRDDEWREDGVELRGAVLKKDGSDSLNRCDEKSWSRSPRPEWLTDAVAAVLGNAPDMTTTDQPGRVSGDERGDQL